MSYLTSSKFSCCSNYSKEGGCSGYWCCSEGSTSTHDCNAKTSPAHTHTCKQEQMLRNSTTIHKNSKQTNFGVRGAAGLESPRVWVREVARDMANSTGYIGWGIRASQWPATVRGGEGDGERRSSLGKGVWATTTSA